MKQIHLVVILTLALALGLSLGAGSASAACFADYKAKTEGTHMRLQYGVARINGASCTRAAAARQLQRRLARNGWTLLNIVSVFGPDGLEERRANAGKNFLRY